MEEVILMNFGTYLKHLDDRIIELDDLKNKASGDPYEYIKLQALYDEVCVVRNMYKKLVIDPMMNK